ncbi:MAG: hypothetical protein IJU66_00005, partial [Oscillospiraceae bacterium]|nr:hypothetical protein [Oscillospiraceae bacterium]
MDSIAVCQQNMTVLGQESLSPFGLLTQLYTKELLERNQQTIGSYRPMQLAYLEEEEETQQQAPQSELHVDLNVELIVNRLMQEERKQKQEKTDKTAKQEKKETQSKPEKQNQKETKSGGTDREPVKTAGQRILERVIVREKELSVQARQTRRVVIENGSRRTAFALPVGRTPASAREPARHNEEGKNALKQDAAKWNGLMQTANKPIGTPREAKLLRTAAEARRTTSFAGVSAAKLPLASMAASVPAAGGWTPKHREEHPGYPPEMDAARESGASAGSILLPDVLRRRREEALARREELSAAQDLDELADALEWSVEGAREDSVPDALDAVRRAVEETLARNRLRTERAAYERAAEETERAGTARILSERTGEAEAVQPYASRADAYPAAEMTRGEAAAAELAHPADLTETAREEKTRNNPERKSESKTAAETEREPGEPNRAKALTKEDAPAGANRSAQMEQTRESEQTSRSAASERQARTAADGAEETAAARSTPERAHAAVRPATATEETRFEAPAPELAHRVGEEEPKKTAAEAESERASAARTAYPAAEETEQGETPPAKLTYQEEDAEEAERTTAARTRGESVTEAEQERAPAARTAYPAAEEAERVEALSAKLAYQEKDAEEAERTTAARTRGESVTEAKADKQTAELQSK